MHGCNKGATNNTARLIPDEPQQEIDFLSKRLRFNTARNASILVPQFRNLISLRAVRQCGWNMRSPRVSRVLDTWWVFFACYHQPPIDFPRSSHTKRKKKRRRKVETRKNISIIEYTQFRIVIKLKLNNKFLVTKLCKKDKSRNLSRFELSFFHRERRQPK